MQSEGAIERVLEIKLAREMQGTAQLRHRLVRRNSGVLVEPFRNHQLGGSADRSPPVFHLDFDMDDGFRRAIHGDRTEPERMLGRHGALIQGNVADHEAGSHAKSIQLEVSKYRGLHRLVNARIGRALRFLVARRSFN